MQEYYIGVDSKEKFSAKIIVLGNTLVGKSSILSRYINNIFSENNEYVTIGFCEKSLFLLKKDLKKMKKRNGLYDKNPRS